MDVDSVGTAVVDNDSWVPVKVEVVVFVEDLLDLFHDASAVVSSQSLDQIMWVSTESTVEELVELDQVTTGTLQKIISFRDCNQSLKENYKNNTYFLQSLFKTSTSVITFTVKALSED